MKPLCRAQGSSFTKLHKYTAHPALSNGGELEIADEGEGGKLSPFLLLVSQWFGCISPSCGKERGSLFSCKLRISNLLRKE